MLKTFSIGGVHPHENKLSAHQPIITAEVPAKAVILLGQQVHVVATGKDAAAFSLLQEQFKQVLETLSPREAGVIKMRYGLEDGQPKTLDDIGRVYGVTRERIRQIESKTMSKLRHPSRSQTLRDFLDQ